MKNAQLQITFNFTPPAGGQAISQINKKPANFLL